MASRNKLRGSPAVVAARAGGLNGYPSESIGSNRDKRYYVKYLIERYHRCRELEGRFGSTRRLQYAMLFTKIEAKFRASTYFIPESRFEELVDYLHFRIDTTILGRHNIKRGISNYRSYDEFVIEHACGDPVAVAV